MKAQTLEFFVVFVWRVFFCFFWGGGGQREGCEKEVQILEEIISQEKKKTIFDGNWQGNQKGDREEEFHRHREKWWLAYYMILLATWSLTPLCVLERKLISWDAEILNLFCWEKVDIWTHISSCFGFLI